MRIRILIVAFVSVAFMLGLHAAPASAADWSVSPYKPMLSEGGSAGQAPADELTTVPTGKKSIGKGVMFSLIIPGTGQLYAGSWLRALPWIAIEAVSWTMFANYHGQGQDKTDEFEAYAGTKSAPNHFSYDAYMLREFQVATNSAYNPTPYNGELPDWKTETWSERQTYLPPPYGHDLNTDDIQQYFEMIGKYFSQFGYGWDDTYPPGTDVNDPGAGAIWSQPEFTDEENTIGFDGQSPHFFAYRDMRGEANDLLEKGNTMMEIVLANHVLSALDAAFAVRGKNRAMEQERVGDLQLNYDIKTVNGSTARFLTASLPLDLSR